MPRLFVAAGITIAGFSAVAVATSAFAIVTTFSLPACNSSESEAGAACSSVTANKGSGETTCGDAICAAGTYCVTDAGNGCAPGCTVTAQCPFGNYCDLTNSAPDLAGNSVGTCTQPTLQQQAPCAEAGASDASTSAGDAGH
ncbi:MAG: hypothetical protein ABI183_15175 [Polyangiaceae bacterium]